MVTKDTEGCGIAVDICVTRRNTITAYLMSRQHDNCGVPSKTSFWRPRHVATNCEQMKTKRPFSPGGDTHTHSHCSTNTWLHWLVADGGRDTWLGYDWNKKRWQLNSKLRPPPFHGPTSCHRMNWVPEENCECRAEAELGIGSKDVQINTFCINRTYLFEHIQIKFSNFRLFIVKHTCLQSRMIHCS